MNADRRKRLNEIGLHIASMKDDIQALLDEEQEAYDNMPESFQNGERGEKAQEVISTLEDAINHCDEIEGALTGAGEA